MGQALGFRVILAVPFRAINDGETGCGSLPFTLDLQILLRLGLAVLCGLAVGMNRAHYGNTSHPNRLRVHVLVGLSACLMVLAAGPAPQARSRVLPAVAPRVGFPGARDILGPLRGG